MGFRIGIVIVLRPIIGGLPALAENLFGVLKPIGTGSKDQGLTLPDTQVGMAEIQSKSIVLSQSLAFELVMGAALGMPAPSEAWLRAQSQTADILVAYMHSITEICGHLVYHKGRRVALHYHGEETDDIVLDKPHLPEWYPASPLRYTEDYVLSLAAACIGMPLRKLLAAEPALQLYEIG